MRKTIIFILSATFLMITGIACNNQKSMQEYIREEKRAIERFVERQGIVTLTSYPKDSIFKENEYYRTPDGLYFRVVQPGNGTWVRAGVDDVQVRFEYFFNIKSYVSGQTDSTVIDYTWFPISFQYGVPGGYAKDVTGLACDGWAIPLQFVTEGAVLDLIIPSQYGSSSDNSNFNPVFYKNLKYTKFYN